MIDLLPRMGTQRHFPHYTNGKVKCLYCPFDGVQMYVSPGHGAPQDEIKATFRFVDSVTEPVVGVCGRYECRQKFIQERRAQGQGELATPQEEGP